MALHRNGKSVSDIIREYNISKSAFSNLQTDYLKVSTTLSTCLTLSQNSVRKIAKLLQSAKRTQMCLSSHKRKKIAHHKTMRKQIQKLIIGAMAVFFMISFSACTITKNDSLDLESKSIVSVEISKKPYKTAYYVGEEINLEGGEITAFYTDGSSEKIPLTKKFIENEITTEYVGSVNIVVKYKEHSLTFQIDVLDKNDIVSQKFLSIASGFRAENESVQQYFFMPHEIVTSEGKTENWQSLKLTPTEDLMILWLSFDIVPKVGLEATMFLDVYVLDYQLYPELPGNRMSVHSQMINFNHTNHVEIYLNAFELMKSNSANDSHIKFNFFDVAKDLSLSNNKNSFAICNLKIVPWPINSK